MRNRIKLYDSSRNRGPGDDSAFDPESDTEIILPHPASIDSLPERIEVRAWHDRGDKEGDGFRRALEVCEEAFDAIVDKSADGVIVLDPSGTICFANTAAEELLGRATGELLGEAFGIPITPGKTTEIDLLRDGLPARVAEMRVVATRWQGEPAYLATIRDMTDRKNAERKVLEAVRHRDEFLAILSHELRNPLAAIQNASMLLSHSPEESDNAQAARRVIERQCGQMNRLLEDLLDVSRLTRSKIELRREPVDVERLLVEAAEAAGSQIDAADQTLAVELPSEKLAVHADPIRMQQVLVNLLSNASKYSKVGARIEMTAYDDGDHVAISVRDYGSGLSAETLGVVFEPFVQLQSSLERSEGGLGLGLAIARGLVTLHEGTIEAQSDGPNTGSTFTVRLPAALTNVVEPSTEKPAEFEGSLRILIVEDNFDVREMLKKLLEVYGHEVEIAPDGRRGIEMIEFQRPDLALVDIGLPVLNGYAVAEHVRSNPECNDVFLVALTGYSQPSDRKKALAAGFDGHLAKPIDMHQLRDLLTTRRPKSRDV